MSSSITCTSIDVIENANELVGPDEDNLYDLPCEVQGGDIVVYGVGADIIVDTTIKLKIRVSEFTLPSATYTTGF